MKQKILWLFAAVSLLLTGCSWLDGNYVHVTPHREQTLSGQAEAVSATNYPQLRSVLEEMVASGTESGVIYVTDYDQDALENNMTMAVSYIQSQFPIGAYAVEEITYEVGANSGKPAIAVSVAYRHSAIEIQKILRLQDMEQAEEAIGEALDGCDAGVVLLIDQYRTVDFSQMVRDFAENHPESVMEMPQVAEGIYGTGTAKVVELTFTYQNSRESLRQMQIQVKPVFDSAVLYVSGEGEDNQKLSQLYAFLMERFDYKVETSITPAYSLLRHGVGDSRAFAVAYASMCRRAGLECQIVTGTRNGEPWTWNIVLDDGNYFHVDLLRCSEAGGFREYVDGDMAGYVWDYSAYPECPMPYVPAAGQETQATETEEATEPTEETLPPTEPTEPAPTENETPEISQNAN